MKGVKHYTKEGEYEGPTHKMDGEVHTGSKHSDSSEPVSHKPFKLREVNSPMKCWKTHQRKPGTTKGAKGSCENKVASKRPK